MVDNDLQISEKPPKYENSSMQVAAISPQKKIQILPALVPKSDIKNIPLKQQKIQESVVAKNDSARLIKAKDIIKTGTIDEKLQALELIIQLAPAEAVPLLRTLAVRSATDESAAALVAHGVKGFSDVQKHLQNSDLNYIYDVSGLHIKKISALMLAERGDEALTQRYLENISIKLKSNDASERSQVLQDMASLGSMGAVPHALHSLYDADAQVRIDALSILSQYGSKDDMAAVEALADDENIDVKQKALETLLAVANKNTTESIMPEQVAFHQESPNSNSIALAEESATQEYYEEPVFSDEQHMVADTEGSMDSNTYVE